MDPATITNLVLQALQAVLNIIASIKTQGGLTDDQILAAAQSVSQGNDQLYQTLKAALQASSTGSSTAA